jgi:hypothetical protein
MLLAAAGVGQESYVPYELVNDVKQVIYDHIVVAFVVCAPCGATSTRKKLEFTPECNRGDRRNLSISV